MTQQSYFDGRTFSPVDDGERCTTQLAIVKQVMSYGDWWTLSQLARAAGASEAGVSARLRDLRKPRFGGYVVEKKRHPNGLWWYRLNGRQVIQ